MPSTVHSDLEKWTAALTAEVEKRQGSDLSAWKKWRDGFWRLGLYKFDRWDPTLQKHTQESFELLIADPGFRAIIVNAVLAIEPGTVCVEKLFNFLSSTAGFMAFAQAATLLAANK